MVAKITTAAASLCAVLIQSIMRALDTSKCGPSRKLPHQEGDHATKTGASSRRSDRAQNAA
jgi:hypothetical protein